MGNFVLTIVLAGIPAPGYQGPPSLSPIPPTYYQSMDACRAAGARARQQFSGPGVSFRGFCAFRGADAYASRNPFGPDYGPGYGW